MRKVLLVLLGITMAFANTSFAQDRTVTGKVTSAEDGSTLPGVNVVIKGTTNGSVTDIDGNYKLSVPEDGGTLVFSFIGLESQEVEVGSQSVINAVMNSDIQQLSEVVVTALGISREKKSLGYSVQELSGEEVAGVKDANIVNSLAGKIAGVQVTGSTGSVGGSSRIIIRGVNSISGNNQPLFVVDGTPIDNANFNSKGTQRGGGGIDYGNTVADINPDDIESMSVLKGASAAALYGSRAANGVILITTKSGSNRKGLGVDFSTGVTFNTVAVLPDYQNQYGGGYKQSFDQFNGEDVVNYAADESWGPKMDGQMVRQWYSWFDDDADFGKLTPFSPHANNIKDFYETGITTNNSLALSGGSENSKFRLSYTNFRQSGTMPETQLVRNSLSLNASTKIGKKLTVSTSTNFVNTNNQGIPGVGYGNNAGNVSTSFNQWFQRQIDMDKLTKYKTAGGKDRTWNISSPTNLDPLYWENPYWVLKESPASLKRSRIFGNVGLKYQIVEGLQISANARTDYYTDRRTEQIASFSIPQDFYKEEVRELRENNYEFLLQYNKNFGENFSLAANLGGNRRVQDYYNNAGSTSGGLSVPNYFNVGASIDRPKVTDYETHKTVNSFFGSASLGYMGILFLDLSLRNDWSSTLPADNNSYLYPSVTGSFVFSELLNTSILSLGKIRAGWSKVGNDTKPYQLATTYSSQNNYGSSPAYAVPNSLKNSNLRPETITSSELGLELNFLENRIGLDVTYYSIEAKDQILSLDVSNTSGFTSAVVNAGMLTNKGWEIMLRGTIIESAFKWDIGINWAKNTNEVVELAEGLDNYLIASWGPSINAKVGQPYGTWVTDGFEYNEQGKKIVNPDGSFSRLTNQTYGSYLPDYTGGVTNNFSYKGFRLSALVDFQSGGQLYSVSNRYGTYSGLFATTVGNNAMGNPVRDPVVTNTDGTPASNTGGVLADGVFADGTPNNVYMDAQSYFKHLRTRREHYLYDASFIKLREVKLTYSLPSKLFTNGPFQSVDISLLGRNLAILMKNVPNVDPESAYGSGNIQGFENGQHPSTRSMGFSINVKL